MTLQELTSKYHWISYNEEENVIEMYLDHHMMSTFRMCEARFELEILNNIRPKKGAWFLDFGVVFHKMKEHFYNLKKTNEFEFENWLRLAIKYWEENEIDANWNEDKTYKALGGLPGLLALLTSYHLFYKTELSYFKIVGTEISFGRGKEVYLGEFDAKDVAYKLEGDFYNRHAESIPVKVYLAGRIDLLMDDGTNICPMDHKTASVFRKDMEKAYDPQEGMLGYVYATNAILKKFFPDENKTCNKIWMNFVQVTPPKEGAILSDRFKRIPMFKTQWQLDRFAERQVATAESILNLVMSGRTPVWNTMVCNNYFHNKCSYRDMHRQGSAEDMVMYLSNDFQIVQAWNTEEM